MRREGLLRTHHAFLAECFFPNTFQKSSKLRGLPSNAASKNSITIFI